MVVVQVQESQKFRLAKSTIRRLSASTANAVPCRCTGSAVQRLVLNAHIHLGHFVMSSKRKWDQPAEEDSVPVKAIKTEEGKTASEAAAAAAAIAAKIAAQFANAGPGGIGLGTRDPHDGEFTHDIDINDVRNRYLLTKGATQTQVSCSRCCSL